MQSTMGKESTILKQTKRGGRRSKKKKQKINNDKMCNFSIVGSNTAGLKAKRISLLNLIKSFNFPSCITLQETKLRNSGKFKISNYQVFEKLRSGQGGGLLTAIDQDLEPVLIQAANEEAEILVVQCRIGDKSIRVINGYGPQESDSPAQKLTFWQALEQEVISAKNENCFVLLELDANAKLGSEIIKNDPNTLSENGELLKDFLDRESLMLMNTSPLCQGVVTRHRTTVNGEEKSVIDFIITCDKLAEYLEVMLIDEKRLFALTKYASQKGRKKIIKSDHNILYAKFSIKYNKCSKKAPQKVIFNFKNSESLAVYTNVTSNSPKLRNCFSKDFCFQDEANTFLKTFEDILHQCFSKVRVTGKTIERDREIEPLLKKRAELIKTGVDRKDQLQSIDDEIGEKVAGKNANLVQEYVGSLAKSDGAFCQLGMWRLKSKLIPRELDPPMAKLDDQGNLITAPTALRQLYLDHYTDRLRHRTIKADYVESYEKKTKLWNLRFQRARLSKSKDWTDDDLTKTLKSLKSNKTRDPSGLLNELFKYPVIGADLENSILNFVNGVKEHYFVPEIMQLSNITTIHKKNMPKYSLNSDRGIFTQSIFKKIIDLLIYHDKYSLLDNAMTDSNIGARKGRNIRNHLFLIYGVINSVLKSESSCVDIQIYDIVKAFDALWLADCMNDLWDTLPHSAQDDKLGLLFHMSKKNRVAVNTSVGQTDRVTIPEIVTQGGIWGPMLCSNSVDKIGKFCKEDDQYFLYKNLVSVIPLACVDDLLAVAPCGVEAIKMNTTINTIIEMKKLEFHIPETGKKSKCHSLHIGKVSPVCPGMKVHGYKADVVKEATYLGDVIQADGKNTNNIKERVKKGIGIVSNIMDILKSVSFGSKYFEIAVTLREACLINGMLTSSEIWYGLTKKEESQLEEVDKLLLRRILEAPNSACVESLYLELGLVPIHILLKMRRLNYLHYLANLNKNEMLSKVFIAQWKYPVKDDWTLKAKENLKDFSMDMSLKDLQRISQYSFKKMVKVKTKEYALDYLLELKSKHSKMNNLDYPELKLQDYLKDPKISVQESKNLFRFRTRTANFKTNMKSSYQCLLCPLCSLESDTQEHSMQCTKVKSEICIVGNYYEIFREDIPQDIAKTLLKIVEFRKLSLS